MGQNVHLLTTDYSMLQMRANLKGKPYEMAISGSIEAFSKQYSAFYSSDAFQEQILDIHSFYSIANRSIHFILEQNGNYIDNLGFNLDSQQVLQDNFRFPSSGANRFFVVSSNKPEFVYTVHRNSRRSLTLIRYRIKCNPNCNYEFRDWTYICQVGESKVKFSKSCQTTLYWNVFSGFLYQNHLLLVSHSVVLAVPTAPNNQSVQVEIIERANFFQCKTGVTIAVRDLTINSIVIKSLSPDGKQSIVQNAKYFSFLSLSQ